MTMKITRMRQTSLIFIFVLLLTGCSTSEQRSANHTDTTTAQQPGGGGGGGRLEGITETYSSANSSPSTSPNTNAAQASNAAAQRRIIRDANLSLEMDDTAAAARRISSIAEGSGGFVTSNEARSIGDADDARSSKLVRVNIVIRVPAERFNQTLEQIRGLGERVVSEKVTGQDVTEEYLDIEARIRTKQALEAQFLEIMKTARTVEDALNVQRQLGDVRTEIEQLEGRRRFLENRTTLSTITITLEPPAPLLTTRPGGFLHELARAFGGGLDAAATILLWLIRIVLALIPLLVFIVLPLALLWRFLRRRAARRAAAASLLNEPTPTGR